MQHQNGTVLRAFLFDALLADGHLDDSMQFSFTIAITKVFWWDTLSSDGHPDDIIEFSQGENDPQLWVGKAPMLV